VDAAQVTVSVRGDVGPAEVHYAQRKVARVTELVGEPVLLVRVKLATAGDPARELPALAQAVVDVNGQLIRAHVAAHDVREAIDLLEARLRQQLESHMDRRIARRRRGPGGREPGQWRRGDRSEPRPMVFPRPTEERQIVRHKSYELHPLSPAEADEEMLRLDFDFHLFTDALSGEDSIVARRPEGGSELIALSAPGVPLLEEAQAAERLDLTGAVFLFYRDATSGRGAVIYRRYDGHYGVVTARSLVSVNHGPGSRALPRSP
jgi:ribosome-associated translation inhibitor RaiA